MREIVLSISWKECLKDRKVFESIFQNQEKENLVVFVMLKKFAKFDAQEKVSKTDDKI